MRVRVEPGQWSTEVRPMRMPITKAQHNNCRVPGATRGGVCAIRETQRLKSMALALVSIANRVLTPTMV